jgi:hypothetical protein
MNFADFLFDCLTVIEMEQRLPRSKVRHALSVYAPLGTPSSTIDEWWYVACQTLLATGLVSEVDNVFIWKSENTSRQAVTADDLGLN